VSEAGQRRGQLLAQGEVLQVSLELNNPATGLAIQLSTKDYHLLGWTPRYLVQDILTALSASPQISATVVRVNDVELPPNRRILIELSGKFDQAFEPMSGPDFQVLH
jgi:hypothetical protein